ncbi:hypothetical protein [Sporohalobacter salinus]|uniref:hypothetical protein n=1 Tax=Sporohalobacter salinus TaxID=1494606 RepID=UPI001EF979EC|nr:hypothetical protein [Sporohalobacter salinus]MBM7622819.1 hypothetical protein [Sporohalobacter salinus]
MILSAVVACLIICGSGVYLHNLFTDDSAVPVNEDIKDTLTTKVQQIFKMRNKALLKEKIC